MKAKFFINIVMVGLCLIIGCSPQDGEKNDFLSKSRSFSFSESAVIMPAPDQVQLHKGGRFHDRYQGNWNYLQYLHEHYGQEMLEAFASRHYSPGKLLERMWDGEYAGKWLDAAVRVAVNSGDQAKLSMVDAFAADLRKYQQADGYMGIQLPQDRPLDDWERSWDNWNQWNCMIGFLTHYEFRGEKASLEAASSIGKWIVKTFSPAEKMKTEFLTNEVTGGMTNIVIINQLMRLYTITCNPDLIAFVKTVIEKYRPIKKMLTDGDPYLFHPYMLGAVLNGVVQFAVETEDAVMLARMEQVWDGLVKDHLFPTGSLGHREDLSAAPLVDRPNGQLQETCATTEWIFLTQRLYAVTGKVKYIEELERTCYNALLAAQSADGMKWCYWTPLRYSKHFLYGPTRCCYWSGPKGIARLPQIVYAARGNDIYVNFFEPSKGNLGTDGGTVQVTQAGTFPEVGRSHITLKTPKDWKGSLHIRMPKWAKDFQVTFNGKPASNAGNLEGYFTIQLHHLKKYKVEIQFELPLLLEKFKGTDYVMRRGPEVLSIDARDNIDTWLGAHDDLVSIPDDIAFLPLDSNQRYQWAGPVNISNRRRYLVKLNDERTSELRGFILTPYADAGNENAAFRTVFPRDAESHYPGDWDQ